MMTNASLSVYNKAVLNRETIYIKAFVDRVFWQDSEGANRVKSGMENVDRSIIYVPFDADFSKPYRSPKEFLNNPDGCMTFRPGDLVVKGETVEETATQKGLEQKYDYVRVISSVDLKDYGSGRMQHIELGAR